MFPWKEFLMRRIKKVQKHKEERDRSGKFKKTRRKEWRQEKEEIFTYLEVPSVFCIGRGRPQATALVQPPSGEPTHMGTSPTTSLDYFQNKETSDSWIQMGCDLFHPQEVLQQIFLSHICST